MAKHWNTTVAPGSSHGLMICCSCSRAIDEGDYRYRDAGDAYVTQHRACLPEWDGWRLLDRQRVQQQRASKNATIAEILAQAEAEGITQDELRAALSRASGQKKGEAE